MNTTTINRHHGSDYERKDTHRWHTTQCQQKKKLCLPTMPTLSEASFFVLAAKLVRSWVRQPLPKQAAPLDLSRTSLEADILLFLACWWRQMEDMTKHLLLTKTFFGWSLLPLSSYSRQIFCPQTHTLALLITEPLNVHGLFVTLGGYNQL